MAPIRPGYQMYVVLLRLPEATQRPQSCITESQVVWFLNSLGGYQSTFRSDLVRRVERLSLHTSPDVGRASQAASSLARAVKCMVPMRILSRHQHRRLEIRYSPIITPISCSAPSQRLILWPTNLASLRVRITFKFRFCTHSDIGM